MNLKRLSFIILIILAISSALSAGTPGSTGLAFLKIGAGSRAAGMGEAYTAVANDASAAYWNPAGLARLKRSEFLFTHNKWFQDISNEYLSFAFLKGANAFGLSFISTNIGGIERRVNPSTDPLDILEAHDIMFAISFARSIGSNIKWGLSTKYLYEKIYLHSSNGFALDAGLIYDLPVSGLTLGAAALNFGAMSKMANEAIKLPTTLKTGLAYKLPVDLYGEILIAGDFVKLLDSSSHTHWGVEYQLKNLLVLRAGYLTGYEEKNFQAGGGIHFYKYRLDYGYAPFTSDIGNAHRISLGIQF